MQHVSPAQLLASLPEAQRNKHLASLSDAVKSQLLTDWGFWARPNQHIPKGDWSYWLIMAGRGFGKTRTGAETVRQWVKSVDMVNLIGATVDDARDIMIEGESGIMSICPEDERPDYKKSERKMIWPNGAVSLIFTADEPDRLRGKQHKALWADEMAAWRYQESWDQAKFGLRLGAVPRAVVTTTPRPVKNVVDLVNDSATIITRGTTYDNKDNLAPSFFNQIINKYEGTRLGRQELNAELLLDVPGALWNREIIQHIPRASMPPLKRVVVAIDPPCSSEEHSNECGIVSVGIGEDDYAYVLADKSAILSPGDWAKRALNIYREYEADCIVAEVNQGGEMVSAIIKSIDPNAPVKSVRASRGKYIRAEPISAIYEQGRVYHIEQFEALEDQMCTFTADSSRNNGSPDRLDALVWAMTEIFPGMVDGSPEIDFNAGMGGGSWMS